MKLLIHWFFAALAVGISAYLLPGISVDGAFAALVAAVALGFINAIIRPVLLVLTLPVNLLTLGLFTLVINALMVQLAAALVPGFSVSGFGWALLFSIVLFLVNAALRGVIKNENGF